VQYREDGGDVDRGSEAAHRQRHHREVFNVKTQACSGAISPDRMYQHFLQIGMGYGPALQRLKNITFNEDGEVIAEVRTFDWSVHEVANHVQLHVIHPATLDAAAQLIYFALTKEPTKLLLNDDPNLGPQSMGLWLWSHPYRYQVYQSLHKVYVEGRSWH
jgi:Polyketide synthase dehydratase